MAAEAPITTILEAREALVGEEVAAEARVPLLVAVLKGRAIAGDTATQGQSTIILEEVAAAALALQEVMMWAEARGAQVCHLQLLETRYITLAEAAVAGPWAALAAEVVVVIVVLMGLAAGEGRQLKEVQAQ